MAAPLDIDRLVDELGLETSTTSHHCRTGWVQMCCPFCDDSTFHLGYERQSGRLSCYRCGAIDLRDWLEAVGDGGTFRDLVERFRLVRVRPVPQELAGNGPGRAVCRLPHGTGPIGMKHTEYLVSRGFDAEAVSGTWGLVGIGQGVGPWQWRLLAPVMAGGRMVSYQGRDVTGTEGRLRWLSAAPEDEAMPIKHCLYGLHLADPSKPLLVVEGPANCWRMGPGAVATFGVTVTAQQRAMLKSWAAGVVLAFDPEPKAQEAARKLADGIADHVPVSILLMDEYEDIAAMPQAEADKLKKEIWA